MEYGQFCPIAKATELIGDKWTLLIIRELLMGGTRFNQLQKGLSQISPTVLSKRLETLSSDGLVVKKKIPGQRGCEYFPTASCQELLPIIISLGEWGIRWASDNLTEKDFDVELLMLYLKRSIVPSELIGRETVIRFKFTDFEKLSDWWIVVEGNEVDLCAHDPGKDIDVYLTTTVKTMIDIWMGDSSYKEAKKSGLLTVVAEPFMIKISLCGCVIVYLKVFHPLTRLSNHRELSVHGELVF